MAVITVPAAHLSRFFALRRALKRHMSHDPRFEKIWICAANGRARFETQGAFGIASEVEIGTAVSLEPVYIEAAPLEQCLRDLKKREVVRFEVVDFKVKISISCLSIETDAGTAREFLPIPLGGGRTVLEAGPDWVENFRRIDFARPRKRNEVVLRDAIDGFLLEWDRGNREIVTLETDSIIAGLSQYSTLNSSVDFDFWDQAQRIFFSSAAADFLQNMASLPGLCLTLVCHGFSIDEGRLSAKLNWEYTLANGERFVFHEWYSGPIDERRKYRQKLVGLIEKMRSWFTVDVGKLVVALKRASKFVAVKPDKLIQPEKANIFLVATRHPLRVCAFGSGVFFETVELPCPAAFPVIISFDPDKLLRILQALRCGVAEFMLSERDPSNSPVGIFQSVRAVIMPCRFDPKELPDWMKEEL